jgi:biotin carboxyl carrier protein
VEYTLRIEEDTRTFTIDARDNGVFLVSSGEDNFEVTCARLSKYHLSLEINGQRVNAFVMKDESGKTVVIDGVPYPVKDVDLIERSSGGGGRHDESPGEVTSPIPATVVAIKVAEGDAVKKNQPVVVVSAMKMEMTLKAPYDGVVSRINVAVGGSVMPGAVLVDIEKSG